ncbi:L-lactate dehydrogenase A chain [Lemmus lemmus]
MGERLGIPRLSYHGWVLKEHGECAHVGWHEGCQHLPEDSQPRTWNWCRKERWKEAHKQVDDRTYDVIKLKGCIAWAIGLSGADLAKSVMKNVRQVHPISTLIKSLCGVKKDSSVFLLS